MIINSCRQGPIYRLLIIKEKEACNCCRVLFTYQNSEVGYSIDHNIIYGYSLGYSAAAQTAEVTILYSDKVETTDVCQVRLLRWESLGPWYINVHEV